MVTRTRQMRNRKNAIGTQSTIRSRNRIGRVLDVIVLLLDVASAIEAVQRNHVNRYGVTKRVASPNSPLQQLRTINVDHDVRVTHPPLRHRGPFLDPGLRDRTLPAASTTKSSVQEATGDVKVDIVIRLSHHLSDLKEAAEAVRVALAAVDAQSIVGISVDVSIVLKRKANRNDQRVRITVYA